METIVTRVSRDKEVYHKRDPLRYKKLEYMNDEKTKTIVDMIFSMPRIIKITPKHKKAYNIRAENVYRTMMYEANKKSASRNHTVPQDVVLRMIV